MYNFYAIQPAFHKELKQHPNILPDLLNLNPSQKWLIFQPIDFEDIYISACSYFEERITMEHDNLILKDMLNECSYQIRCEADFIQIDDLDNPFLKLLERKYHYCIFLNMKQR